MAPGSPEVDELSPTDYSDDSVDMRRSVSPPKRKRSDAGDDGGKRRRTASAAGFQPYSMAPPPLIHPLDSNHNWSEELSRMTLLQRWTTSAASPIPELSPWRSTWPLEGQYPPLPFPFQFYPPPLHFTAMAPHPFLPAPFPFHLPHLSATLQHPLYSGSYDAKLTPVPTLSAPVPAPVEARAKSQIQPDQPADSTRTGCSESPPQSALPPRTNKRPAFLSVETLLADGPCGLESKKRCHSPPDISSGPAPPPPRCDKGGGGLSRNYKSMSHERRQQANARERTRVHTISAAFENLRGAVPSFSQGQRLSKLSILRVASAYIMALGKLADGDADDTSTPTLTQCVDLCTQALMNENAQRRRSKLASGSDDDY